MKRLLLASIGVAGLISNFQPAYSQQSPGGMSVCQTQPAALSVTATSSSVQFGTCGPTAVLWNTGTNTAFIKICGTVTCTATAANAALPGGTGMTVNIDPAGTWIGAITASSTTTVRIVQGVGGPAIAGGGSGGGGGGGGVITDIQDGNGTSIMNQTAHSAKTSEVDSAGGDMTDTTNHALKVVGIGVVPGTAFSTQTQDFVGGLTNTNAPAYSSGNIEPLSQTVDGGLRIAGTAPATTLMQSAAVANGNGTSLNVAGYTSAALNILCSVSCSGGTTINFEASVDTTTFVAIPAINTSTGAISTTTTAPGDFRLNVAGYSVVRARISAYSAGTISVKGYQTTANTNNTVVIPAAGIGAGATPKHFVAANSDNATSLKASPGTVYGVQLSGIGSAPAYLKFYDKASAPTCGSDAVVGQYMIPANSTAANGGGNNTAFPVGKKFTTGIAYCVVTGIGDSDDTSPAAATFVVNIDYN